MVSLPGFVFCFMLLKTCWGSEPTTTVTTEAVTRPFECPGTCIEEHDCIGFLNDTECANDLVCCIEYKTASSTEYSDWGFTTLSTTEADPVTEYVQFLPEEGQNAQSVSFVDSESEDSKYTHDFSDESEVSEPDESELSTCPGACLPNKLVSECDYVLQVPGICAPETTCCVTKEYAYVASAEYSYELAGDAGDIEKQDPFFSSHYECPGTCVGPSDPIICEEYWPGLSCALDEKCCVKFEYTPEFAESLFRYEMENENLVKRAVPDGSCPGTCVHPSHSMFCEQILPQFACPLNAKCCIKRSPEREYPAKSSVECTGQCLPQNMLGYCFPPNELILGVTTCKLGTTCCMVRSLQSSVQPPSLHRMQFPNAPDPITSPEMRQMVLGHLAVDDAGTIFKVDTNGQAYPIPRLNGVDPAKMKLKKLIAYPRKDGEMAIFSDFRGALYQQFYPRFAHRTAEVPKTSTVQKPEEQLEEESKLAAESAEVSENMEDIVIPDDDDEPPVETNTPIVYDGKASRPACPGSCMSYFLRFTCFRGYATYDGFTCPGKSVCCARLKDIEDHEEYLKSLSPYFKEPKTSVEKMLHGCGIKGRRDTPRVIGGKEALPGEWCWQVAVINVQNQYICGGALIGDSWVLTAAHCVVGPTNENQAIFVRVGVTDLKSPEDNNKGQTVRVMSTFIHHNFNTVNLDNNIALLRLQKPVELNKNVCVVCLPTSGKMPQENVKCTVTGYGFISIDGDMSLKVNEAQVPIIDDTDCMANVTEALANPFILPASSFCAGGQGQQDACQGDAGGPLVCEIGGFHELVGLVSWSLGCGREDVPSIYIKVPTFMGWINQIISSSSFLMSLS
ncbi:protein masquerade [Trichonephila clavipes]|nr:protein masquerade [Trichonephila clavipes]